MRCLLPMIGRFTGLATFLFVSCGYQSARLPPQAQALAIPFVRGDRSGSLTAALSEAALREGFRLDRASPWVLDVEVGPFDSVDIGRLYERCNNGALTQIAVPNEGRLSATARVRLRDRSGRVLAGPFDVSENIAYDFQSDLIQTTAFVSQGQRYSLLRYGRGQLDFYGAAQDAASRRLEKKLSQRMMELIRAASACIPGEPDGLYHSTRPDPNHSGEDQDRGITSWP
jgi:hypothetical protein